MPDESGALTNIEKSQLQSFLQSKFRVGFSCSLCGNRNWSIGDHLVAAPIFLGGGGIALGGPSYPAAMLVCNNCGNVHHINALVSGVLSRELPNTGDNKTSPQKNET